MTAPALDAILADAHRRAAELRPLRRELEYRASAAPAARPFGRALVGTSVGVVAEIKRRSPSAGEIRSDLDPVAHAAAYVVGGAVAVSVLSDSAHFGGSLDDVAAVARAVAVPVVRKDFIVDPLQLLEARAAGASVVLLIVRAVSRAALGELAAAARQYGLATLVEVHAAPELERALEVEPAAVGVNSRDLATFAVDVAAAERVIARIPAGVAAVAESGIEERADVERLARAGADFVLVGTAVARAADPADAVRRLTGVPRVPRPS